MDELFQLIEKRVHSLIKKNLNLLNTNQQLIIKQKNAISQIENMVARLKSIEEIP